MLTFIKSIFVGAVILVVTYFAFKAYIFFIKKIKNSNIPIIIKWPIIAILVIISLLVLLYGGMMIWTVFDGAWEAIQ